MRAYTPKEILSKKYEVLQWRERWVSAFGRPETTGIFCIVGNSTNGKSSLIVELAKELAEVLGKGFLNPYEEGTKITFQELIKQSGLDVVNGRVGIRKEPIIQTINRALKPKSPKFFIIDSIQALRLTRKEYALLQEISEKKLIIFISRAEGKSARGKLAQDIWFDADQKIWVEGFKAISMGRHNAGGEYVIWDEGATKYWGTKLKEGA